MTNLFKSIFFCLCLTPSWFAFGEARIPNMGLRHVIDDVGALSKEEILSIENEIRYLNYDRGVDLRILLVHSIAPEPLEKFSLRVAEKWRPGRKGLDDGVILVIVSDDKKARLEIGYGVEGAVPDIKALQIVNLVTKDMSVGDYEKGILSAVGLLYELTESTGLPPYTIELPSRFNSGTPFFLFGVLVWYIFSFLLTGIQSGGLAVGATFIVGLLTTWPEINAPSLASLTLGSVLLILMGGGRSSGSYGSSSGGSGSSSSGGGSFGGGGASGNW